MHIRGLVGRTRGQGQIRPGNWDPSSPPPSGGLHFRSELHTAAELAGRTDASQNEHQESESGTAA